MSIKKSGGRKWADVDEVLVRLEEFRLVYAHLYVPDGWRCSDGFRLGSWVARRRRDYRCGRLHSRYVELEGLAGWDWTARHRGLVEGLERLQVYAKRCESADVPCSYECDDGFKLGCWVKNRRRLVGKQPWLDEILEALPGWRGAQAVEEQRRRDRLADEELLRRVRRFHAQWGTCRVPSGYVCEDGFELGAVMRRRRRWTSRRQREFLQALGDLPERRLWPSERGLSCLWEYVREHADARPPFDYVTEDGFKLGSWVRRRRSQRGKNPVLDAQLESLPGWCWDTRDLRFKEGLARFEAAHAAGALYGDLWLRRWVRRQAGAAARGALSPNRLEQLQRAGVLEFASAQLSYRYRVHREG